MILAPLAAGPLLPGSRAFGLETFWNERWSEASCESHTQVRTAVRKAGPAGRRLRYHVPRGVTALVTAPGVRCGGRAPGPGAPRMRTRSGSRRSVTGSRPQITPATAARIRRGVTSPSHGDHGAPPVTAPPADAAGRGRGRARAVRRDGRGGSGSQAGGAAVQDHHHPILRPRGRQ